MTQRQLESGAISSTFFAGVCAVAIVFVAITSEAVAAPVQQSQELIAPGPSATLSPTIGVTSFALKADDYDIGATSGFSVGAQYAHTTGIKNVAWEAGIHYFEGGGQQGNIFISNKLQLSYLAIPMGARWKFVRFGQTEENSIYIKGGMAAAFLLSAKQKVSVWGESSEKDIKSETNAYDLLAYVGLGTTYNLGEAQSFSLELNYMQGTQKVFKAFDSKNEGLIASVMYTLTL